MPEIIVKLGENIVHKYIFEKEIMSIGRARDNDVVIENLSVSRNHARIRKEGDRFILTDLNSANGTFVNGVRVTRVEIVDEDVVTIGKHKLHFLDKTQSDEEVIGEAFGSERTMLVDRAQAGKLVVTKGKQKDQSFQISKYETYIGRASDNDIRLHDWFVSKKHAVVIRQGANFFIKDLGSWRGTMVNGKNIRDCELKDTDEIQLGTTVLTFQMEAEVPELTGRVPREIGYDEGPGPVGAVAASQGDAFEDEMPEAAKTPAHPAAASKEEDLGVELEESAGVELGAAPHEDDEFAPLSHEELEELEAEEERELGARDQFDFAVPASEPDGEVESEMASLAVDDVENEEEKLTFEVGEGETLEPVAGLESTPDQEEEELASLMGAEGDGEELEEKVGIPQSSSVSETEAQENEPVPVSEPPSKQEEAPVAQSDEMDAEVAMWLNAIKNKSRIIRREAARKLKHLTGRDYDWESEPE